MLSRTALSPLVPATTINAQSGKSCRDANNLLQSLKARHYRPSECLLQVQWNSTSQHLSNLPLNEIDEADTTSLQGSGTPYPTGWLHGRKRSFSAYLFNTSYTSTYNHVIGGSCLGTRAARYIGIHRVSIKTCQLFFWSLSVKCSLVVLEAWPWPRGSSRTPFGGLGLKLEKSLERFQINGTDYAVVQFTVRLR